MFSMRIVSTDHYLSVLIPGLDVQYSESTGSEFKMVPVVRIYGSTPAGHKTCMHVHGVFPYLYVPYDGTEPWKRYLRQFAICLDTAINVALGYGQSNTRHVYKVVLVTGSSMYRNHEKEREYLKIYFYNPNVILKSADLLLGGAVLNKQFQPHEAHIHYVLQYLIDYNLYGMNLIDVAAVKFRQKIGKAEEGIQHRYFISPEEGIQHVPVRSNGDSLTGYDSGTRSDTSCTSLLNQSGSLTSSQRLWDNDNIPSVLHVDYDIDRMCRCQLEVDVMAANILNRHVNVSSLDKSLVDISAGMIDESLPHSMKQAPADATLTGDQDSILSQASSIQDKYLEENEDKENQEKSQHIWKGEDKKNDAANNMCNLAGMDYSTWLDSMLDDVPAAAASAASGSEDEAEDDCIPQYDGNGDEKEEFKQVSAEQLGMRGPINPRSPTSRNIDRNPSCMPQFGSSGTMLQVNQSLKQLYQGPNQQCVNTMPQSGVASYSKAVDWNQYETSSNQQRLESDLPRIRSGALSYSQHHKFIQPPCSLPQSKPIGSMQQSLPIGNQYGFHGNQSSIMPIYNDSGNQRNHGQFQIQRFTKNQQLCLNLSQFESQNNSVSYISPRSQSRISPQSQNQHSPMSYSGDNDPRIIPQNQQPISPPTVSQSLKQAQSLARPLSNYSPMPPVSEQNLQSQTSEISRQHTNRSFPQAGSYIVKQPSRKMSSSTAMSQEGDYHMKYGLNCNQQYPVSTSVVVPSQIHLTQQHVNLLSSQSVPHDVAITSSFNKFAKRSSQHEGFHNLLNNPNSVSQSYLIKRPDFNATISGNQQPDNTVLNYRSLTRPNYCEDAQNYHNISSLSHQRKEFHEIAATSSFKSQTTSVEGQFMQMQQEKFHQLASPSSGTDFSPIDTLSNSLAKVQGPLPTSQLISTDQKSKSAEPFLGPVTKYFTRKLAVYEQISPPSTPTGKQNSCIQSIPGPNGTSSDKQLSPLQKLLLESSRPVKCERSTRKLQRNLSRSSLSSLSSYGSECIGHRTHSRSASYDMSKDAYLLKRDDDNVNTNGFPTRFFSLLSEQQNQNDHQKDRQDSFDSLSSHHSFSINESSQNLFAESFLPGSNCVDNFENSMERSNDSSNLPQYSDVSKVAAGDCNIVGNATCRNDPSFNRQKLDKNSALLSNLEHFVGSVRKDPDYGALYEITETVSEKHLVSETQPQTQDITCQQSQNVQNQSHPSHLYPQLHQLSQQQHLEWSNVLCQQSPGNDVQSTNPVMNYVKQNQNASRKRGRPLVRKSLSISCGPVVATLPYQKKRRGRPRKNEQMQMAQEVNYPVAMGLQQHSTNFSNNFSLKPIQQSFYPSQGSFQQLLAEDNSDLLAEFSNDLYHMQNDFPQQYNIHPNENALVQQTGNNQFHHNTPHNISQEMQPQPPPQLHQYQRFHHEIRNEAQPSPEFHLLQAMQISDSFSNFDTVNPEALLPKDLSPEPHNYQLAISDENFEVDMSAQQNTDNVDHRHLVNSSMAPRTEYTLNDSSILELIRYRQKSPKLSLSYTYRFEVPTPLFKRLKLHVKNVFDTTAHPLNVVRMHPKDARKYSLLKIGKEIIQLDNLSDSKIKNIQDNMKTKLHENSIAPSVTQVCDSETLADKTSCDAYLFADSQSNGDLLETSQMVGAGLNISLPLKSTVNEVQPIKCAGQNLDSFMNRQRKNGISKEKKTNSMFQGRNIANIPHLKKFRAGFPYFGKGYVGRGANKMKQNHPKLGPEYDDDGKIVIKDVNLTDASEGTFTPIRGRTPVAGHSPAHDGGILPDVESQSQIPVLLDTKLKDLEYDLDLNQSGNSQMFPEELFGNKEIEKLCNEGEDCEMKERDVESDLENGNKHSSGDAYKCYNNNSAEKMNELESYIELEQVEKIDRVDSFVCDMKQNKNVTLFEDLLQKDLLKRVKTDEIKELDSNDLIERKNLNCDELKHLQKHMHRKVAINSPNLQNNTISEVEVNKNNIALNIKVECLDGFKSNCSDYQVIDKSSLQMNSALISGDEFVVNKDASVTKRRQSIESQNSDSCITAGKRHKRQSISLNSCIPGSRNSSRSSSFDTDGRKRNSKAKRTYKRSYRYDSDSDGIPGVDYIVINKFKGQKELRVVVDRMVVSDREVNIQKLEQSNKKKNGFKRRNSTDCVFKRALPNSVSLNIEPHQKGTGFSAEFEKLLSSKSQDIKTSDSDTKDCDISGTLNIEDQQRNTTEAMSVFKYSLVKKEPNVQNQVSITTCDYLSKSTDENHTMGIKMLDNTRTERAITDNEYPLQPGLKDFCSSSDEEASEVNTRIEPKSFKNKTAKSEVKKKRTNTIHDGRAFCSRRHKRRRNRPNAKPSKLMCTLSVLHDATMEKLTNFQISEIDTSSSNQSPMKSSKETSDVDSPFRWPPRIKTPDFEIYSDKTGDHMSTFKDSMYKLAFLSPMSSDDSSSSPPWPLSPKDMIKCEATVEQHDKFAEHREQKMTFADILKSVEKECTEQVQVANSKSCLEMVDVSSCEEVKNHIRNHISDRPGTPCKVVIAHTATLTLKDIKSLCQTEVKKDTVHVIDKANVIQSDVTSPDLGPPVCQSFPGIETIDDGSLPPKLTPNSEFDAKSEVSEADHCASSKGDKLGSMPPFLTPCRSPRILMSPKEMSSRCIQESNSVMEHCSDFSLPLDFESKVKAGRSPGTSSLTGSINVVHSEEFSDISDGEESSHTTDYHQQDNRNEWVKSMDKIAHDSSLSGHILHFKHRPNKKINAKQERKLNAIKVFEERLQKSEMQTGCLSSQTISHAYFKNDKAVPNYSTNKNCFQPVCGVAHSNVQWNTLQPIYSSVGMNRTTMHLTTDQHHGTTREHVQYFPKSDAKLESFKCRSSFQEFPDPRDYRSYVPNFSCSSQTISQNGKVHRNVFDNFCVSSNQDFQNNTDITGNNNVLFGTCLDFSCSTSRSVPSNSRPVCDSSKLEYSITPNSRLNSKIIQKVHSYESNKAKMNVGVYDNIPCNNFGCDKETRRGNSTKSGHGQGRAVSRQSNFGSSSVLYQSRSHRDNGQSIGKGPVINTIDSTVGMTSCQVTTPVNVPPSRGNTRESAAHHFLTAFQPINAFYSNFRDTTEKPSMFILLKGWLYMDDAFKTGQAVARTVTAIFPSPIQLEFEMVGR